MMMMMTITVDTPRVFSILLSIPGFLAVLSDIRAGWCTEINGKFEAERPPVSAGPHSGG